MKDKLSAFWSGFKDKWSSLAKNLRIFIITAVSVVIVAAIVLAIVLNQKGYTAIYTGLDSEESSQVVSAINELGITDVKMGTDGSISVPSDQADNVRMQLSIQGYPKSTFNFDVWNSGIGIWSTDTEKKVLQIQQLQTHLMKAINTISAVKNSYVIITMPENSNYVISTDSEEPRVSVKLDLKNGAQLTSDQVEGIYALVLNSLPGLERENISILDSDGKLLSGENTTVEEDVLYQSRLNFQEQMQSLLKSQLNDTLKKLYKDYTINVNVKLNYDNSKSEYTIYTPSVAEDGTSGGIVDNTGDKLNVRVGDKLIGRIIDALGNPLDDGEPIEYTDTVPIAGIPVNPLTRPKIHEPIELGVKAIDGLLTMGKGQRMGIFAGSGVGKSTLMGMIARKVKADLNVIALVGERGREVREFIENDLGEEGMARSVVVVATSDQPAMMRNKCPMTATAIAEYFCSQGKDVLLMMDNLTRFAMAQREIGLSTGEPPVARGYTPSIYAAMPKLLERAGNFEKGSITGIYAVLVEGDDTNEPISDTVRGIIDGHIVLSRKIAAQNHYPAIDILPSISRLMSAIADPEHNKAAGKLRNLLALYNNNADLISIGAYKKGTNPALDEAIKKIDKINDFLMQGMYESFSMEDTIKLLKAAVS